MHGKRTSWSVCMGTRFQCLLICVRRIMLVKKPFCSRVGLTEVHSCSFFELKDKTIERFASTWLSGRQRLRSSLASALAVPLTRLSTIGDWVSEWFYVPPDTVYVISGTVFPVECTQTHNNGTVSLTFTETQNQWLSVPCRCSKNVKQSATKCDVFKLPTNI